MWGTEGSGIFLVCDEGRRGIQAVSLEFTLLTSALSGRWPKSMSIRTIKELIPKSLSASLRDLFFNFNFF